MSYLRLKLPRLIHFNAEILELPSQSPDFMPLLWSADVRLLVATPAVRPVSPELLSLISHPSTFLIIQYPPDNESIIEHTLVSLARKHPELIPKITVYPVYPHKALSASDTFRISTLTTNSVDAFQRDYIESGILPIIEKIQSLVSTPDDTLERKRSSSIVTGTIEACCESIRAFRGDVRTVQNQITRLRLEVESLRQKHELEVTKGLFRLDIPVSIRRSTLKMTGVLQSISWWKLPFMVDDLSAILNDNIRHNWCPDVITCLEFHAGRLYSLREQLIFQTMANYSQLPRAFQSSVLKNTLEQYSSDLNGIGPNVLSYAVSNRIKQLSESVTRLHRQIQNALLTFFGGALGSSGAAYAAWFWQYIPGYDALGWGGLGIIVMLRFFVRNWHIIQERWWADWNRAGKGLERDINNALKTTMENRVLVVPLKAIEVLEETVQHRTASVDATEKELDDIKAGLPMFLH
ncbi:hypothetical protein Clacol_000587 [Clathrus columnatus]|uniref:Mmc1 C-terminal domain-containing protein n=1 Tax=Clathrus columnatus TaxID=1419009 RepID=A0AAV5A1D3_9AGAM|nr:hypothetical protein Clacol_000587 [Clathrus columnatus]